MKKYLEDLLIKGKPKEPSLHDRTFKILFRSLKWLSLLKELVLFILKKGEETIVKIGTLRLEHGSSTGNGLQDVHSDSLCSLNVTSMEDLPNEADQMMMLFDHKSHQSPKDIPQLRTYRDRLSKDYGCMVLPVFFYHGKAVWNKSLTFQDQFKSLKGIPKSLLQFVNFFHYRLIDLQRMDISKVRSPILRLIFFAFQQIWFLKDGRDARLRVLEEFFGYAKQIDKKYDEVVEVLLAYFLEYDDNLTWDIIKEVAEKTGYKEGGKTMESLKYTVEGALERGIEQGLQKKEQSVVLNMLKKKMDLNIIVECTGVSKEQVLELQKQADL